jgi:hypothetical protein
LAVSTSAKVLGIPKSIRPETTCNPGKTPIMPIWQEPRSS